MWCDKCRASAVFIQDQSCPICNQISNAGRYCLRHKKGKSLGGIVSVGYFKDQKLKSVIYAYKYEGLSALSTLLGQTLFNVLEKEKIKYDVVAFIPTTRKRYSWRGYNQSEEIAKVISKITALKLVSKIEKSKETKPQVGLSKKERQKNLYGKFKALPGLQNEIKGKKILLIDDVVTTGSTLNECAKVLKAAGAKSAWGAVVAKE